MYDKSTVSNLQELGRCSRGASFFPFIKYARKKGIVAVPNSRSLHQDNIVKGGGIIIALVFLTALCTLSFFITLDN